LGRRRPFILFGIPISVFFLAVIPAVGHANHHAALPLIIVSVILFSISWNIAGDPYQALMVDITTEHERSTYNAILSVISLVGQVVILLYASFASLKKNTIPDLVFYACAAFLLLSYAVVFLGVREPRGVCNPDARLQRGAQATPEHLFPLDGTQRSHTFPHGLHQRRDARG
jgi:Na+/melibiose symporter-like transporter